MASPNAESADRARKPDPTTTQHPKPLFRLFGYTRPYLGLIAIAILFTLAHTGAEGLRNYLIQPLFDDVIIPARTAMQESAKTGSLFELPQILGGASEEQSDLEGTPAPAGPEEASASDRTVITKQIEEGLFKILSVALIVILIAPIALFVRDYLIEYVLGRVRIDIQKELCAKLLALPLSFHKGTTRGELLSRITNDVNHSHLALRLFFGDFIQAFVRITAFLCIMFWISWQLSLVVLLIAPVIIGSVSIFGKKVRKSAKRRQEKVGDVTQRLTEILSGIKVIQAFRGEEREARSFANENRQLFKRQLKVIKNRILSRSIIEMLTHISAIAIIVLGAWVVSHGMWGLTLGSLGFFIATLNGVNRPTKTLTKGWNQLMDSLPAAERFFELMDTPLEMQDAPDAVPLDGVREGIRFENLSFSYGREPVLDNINLDVRPGEVVALVGRTGAGKSTLMDLLLRFYDPQEGRIAIDGTDLRDIQRSSLLDHIAVVTQESFLFQGTIYDNIRYGRPDASDEDIHAAARAAHVDEFADQLEQGYDTDIGEAGSQLSGGQRQRITIARALLMNPEILIFDEATSALDAQSERLVQDAIDVLLEGRTVFIIAHRLSTINHADKIVVLEEGGISRIGTHAELVDHPGLYKDLFALQSAPRS